MSFDTVGFKKDSGAAQEDIEATEVIALPNEVDDEEYTQVDFTRKRLINAEWKRWQVNFAFLTEAQMDYLNELLSETEPQFIYDSTTYDVLVQDSRIQQTGGSIVLINTVKEA